jgi:hypothetical protein
MKWKVHQMDVNKTLLNGEIKEEVYVEQPQRFEVHDKSFFRNIFIGQNFDMTSTSISDLALYVSLPSQPSRSKAYTPLFLLSRSLGNPSQWITCLACRPPRKEMIVCLWSLIGFRRWPSSHPVRRMSQRQILLSSSSNECGSTSGYHRPSSLTKTNRFLSTFWSIL